MKRLLLATALLAAPMLAHAADAPKIDPAKLATHIKVLSSDDFEGRGPATAGETKTVAYVTQQMKAVGLEPGGDDSNLANGDTVAQTQSAVVLENLIGQFLSSKAEAPSAAASGAAQ